MAEKRNSLFLFLPTFLSVVAICLHTAAVQSAPPLYIFGDSLIDVGTNSFLNDSIAKANFPYNGIDYPTSQPTGRFSNGYNLADFIAMQFGFDKSPPPFLYLLNQTSQFQNQILQGVNFASAGAGIFDETGTLPWKEVVSLRAQIQQFATVQSNITRIKGPKETAAMLANSLFVVWMGANDFFDHMRSNSKLPKDKLIARLESAYYLHLKNLFNLGARVFIVINVPPIGCCPYARALKLNKTKTEGCMDGLNDFAQTFNAMAANLLPRMETELTGMIYFLLDSYEVSMNIFGKYTAYGFKTMDTACCGNGSFNGVTPCYKPWDPKLCQNRTEYLFWDLYHPTEAASKLAVSIAYGGNTTFVKPVGLSQLMGMIQNP